jgi:hypothetical protein
VLEGNSFSIPGLSTGATVDIVLTVQTDGPCGEYEVAAGCSLDTPVCPEINVPADTFICNGASVILDFADTPEWSTYSWSPATGLSCTDCPAPAAAPGSTTTYQLIASDAGRCADTVAYTVYVQQLPNSYIPDGAITFCPGEAFELCMPDGDVHYWIGPNAFITTNQCLSFDNITAADAGNYYAFMRSNGCRFIKAFTLEAAPELEVAITPDFQTVCPNDTFSLTAIAPGANSLSWSPADYLDCSTCSTVTGSVPQTATFVLTATDTFGCTATGQAVVFTDDCAPAPRPGNDVSERRALKVFPNPATHEVNVRTPLQGLKTLQLWSATGQMVSSLQFEGQQWALPVEQLPAGAYFLKVFTPQKTEQVRLIITR